MTVALIMLIVFGVTTAGGFQAVMDNAKGLAGYLSFTQIHNATEGTADKYSFLTIISTLAWGLGYFGMPHILLRFMAIGDTHKIKTSRRIASIWVVISMGVAIFIGLIGNCLSANGHIAVLEGSSAAETVVIQIATLLSQKGVVVALLAGLIFAGILACTMSTSDSQLLAASSSMSENLLRGVFRINLSQRASMITARVVLLLIAALSVVIAWNPDSSVFQIVSFAWAGFGATFGPVVLAALFWKRSNKWGALCGLLAGGIMVFVWKFCIRPLGGAWDIYELLPAFLVATLAIVVGSLLTASPSKEIQDEFECVKEKAKM
jgi:sodium/proline symporter